MIWRELYVRQDDVCRYGVASVTNSDGMDVDAQDASGRTEQMDVVAEMVMVHVCASVMSEIKQPRRTCQPWGW